MTLTRSHSYSLIRGCALFHNRARGDSQYLLGTLGRVAAITSSFQRTALIQLADGLDPLARVNGDIRFELEIFLQTLAELGFLNHKRSELTPPKRYLAEAPSRDRAINQLRERSAPELAQSEWIDGAGDGGTSTLAHRSQFPIELSGRSRTITLLYSILLSSGVTQVRFADRHHQSVIGDLDIGAGAISSNDLALNYYELLESRRRGLSLFPIEVGRRFDLENSEPLAVIHYGDCDPEEIVEWSQRKIPHLLIHAPIGDEIVIGPLVIPGESPCIRCLSLYEIDNWGITRLERIPLTMMSELPMATAHYVAALAASQILHFIDSYNSKSSSSMARNTAIGEVTYLNFQKLAEPQVVAISRHPLCGCAY